MSGSVVLISGGLDSALCLLMAQERGDSVVPVFADYGQQHRDREYERALGFVATRGLPGVEVIRLPTLVKSDDVVYVGRNLMMISAAVPIAANYGFDKVWIGSNWSDRERFPDCRPEFIKGARTALDAYGVHLYAPLMDLTKSEVVKELRRRGQNTDDFWSCYAPNGDLPCGKCLACEVRTGAGA